MPTIAAISRSTMRSRSTSTLVSRRACSSRPEFSQLSWVFVDAPSFIGSRQEPHTLEERNHKCDPGRAQEEPAEDVAGVMDAQNDAGQADHYGDARRKDGADDRDAPGPGDLPEEIDEDERERQGICGVARREAVTGGRDRLREQ